MTTNGTSRPHRSSSERRLSGHLSKPELSVYTHTFAIEPHNEAVHTIHIFTNLLILSSYVSLPFSALSCWIFRIYLNSLLHHVFIFFVSSIHSSIFGKQFFISNFLLFHCLFLFRSLYLSLIHPLIHSFMFLTAFASMWRAPIKLAWPICPTLCANNSRTDKGFS